MLCDGWEVCVEFAEGFHNRRSVWCVLEHPMATVRRYYRRVQGDMYKFSCDAVVEIFDCTLVGVGGECSVRCPIRGGVKEFDCVCYPRLSGCHPCTKGVKINGEEGTFRWMVP